MSPLKAYQQLIRRLTISILFTLINAAVISVCLLSTFGGPNFWAALGLTGLLVWTLWTMWQHTLADAEMVEASLSAVESQDAAAAKHAA
jgi:hypothetical protein